jgi:hypothetical protein
VFVRLVEVDDEEKRHRQIPSDSNRRPWVIPSAPLISAGEPCKGCEEWIPISPDACIARCLSPLPLAIAA